MASESSEGQSTKQVVARYANYFEIGHNAAPAGVDVALIMEYLLDDGRVVLTLGGDPAHNYAANYATIPADAFLSGSTEYTEMEFVG